jgi:hypothetical protein
MIFKRLRERVALARQRNVSVQQPDAPAQEPSAPTRPISVFETSFNLHGILQSAHLDEAGRRDAALYFPYRERAEIAMVVAGMYSGGDYLEFGSEGMGTFRNFLSAFHINGLHDIYPGARFYAFDVFGDVTGTPEIEKRYFDHWKDEVNDRLLQAEQFVKQHGVLVDRCTIVKGHFDTTLSAKLKESLTSQKRAIGCAFLDCNRPRSYKTVFGFLDGLVGSGSFVYMDEYLLHSEIRSLFGNFRQKLLEEHGLEALRIRNAGAFGSLYRFVSIAGPILGEED